MKLFRLLSVLFIVTGFASAASATPITNWTLSNVNLTGSLGAIAVTGSFTNDSPTDLTTWDITLSGAVNEEFKNSTSSFHDLSSSSFYLQLNSPFAYISFDLASPLVVTAAPTTLSLLGNGTNVGIGQNTFTCVSACSELQTSGAASLTNVADPPVVPEPATIGLLGSGLMALVARRRARKIPAR
jgi:hypothetical protein